MSQRSDQVAEELRKIVSRVLLEDLHDPRIGFVTITRIEITGDLRHAKVFYSILGDANARDSTLEALEENRGLIKKLTIERLNMKYAPEIKFEEDKSIEHVFKIDEILRSIKKKNGM
ncbi:MAG: 30S ribosome-binding factor RbfA [Candidatus Omnitrophica bacterium]|nr:30S ribosome-binding factor RbfA [Candidatus Omnitrophota bacterium]